MNDPQQELVRCNVCGSDASQLLFASASFPGRPLGVVRCRSCGLIYRNIRLKGDALRRNCEQWDNTHLSPELLVDRKALFATYPKWLEPYRQSNRILDVGAGFGFFLNACARCGWECYGVEISRKAVDFAKAGFGLNMVCGAFEDACYPDGFFDALAFMNSLEFLPDPKAALRKAYALLRPGGAVMVRFSNAVFHVAAYRFFLLTGRLHPGFGRTDLAVIHLYAFDPYSIRRLLLASGFTGIQVLSLPLSWMTRNDVHIGCVKRLACQLAHGVSYGCSLLTFGKLLISPSLTAIARKE